MITWSCVTSITAQYTSVVILIQEVRTRLVVLGTLSCCNASRCSIRLFLDYFRTSTSCALRPLQRCIVFACSTIGYSTLQTLVALRIGIFAISTSIAGSFYALTIFQVLTSTTRCALSIRTSTTNRTSLITFSTSLVIRIVPILTHTARRSSSITTWCRARVTVRHSLVSISICSI